MLPNFRNSRTVNSNTKSQIPFAKKKVSNEAKIIPPNQKKNVDVQNVGIAGDCSEAALTPNRP